MLYRWKSGIQGTLILLCGQVRTHLLDVGLEGIGHREWRVASKAMDPQYLADVRFGRRKGDSHNIHYPVNLGNPRETTVLEIAKLVLSITNSPSGIQHQPLPVDDPKVRRPDINRAKRVVMWEPSVDLEAGLEKTTEYFRKIIQQ